MSFQQFATLIARLDQSNSTLYKVELMAEYLGKANPADAAWAVFFLSGRRLKRLISSRQLRLWFLELSGLPEWLYAEAYNVTGDTAETLSLLQYVLPAATAELPMPDALHQLMTDRLIPLAAAPDALEQIHALWAQLPPTEGFVLNKLLSGAFRIGVSQGLLVKALAQVSGLDAGLLQHRLMGQWEPTEAFYTCLLQADQTAFNLTQPYPFYLAYSLEKPFTDDDLAQWQLEWKWDGIRGQLIHRQGVTALWSRGEELISERFPELTALAQLLPDGTVLDGEVLAYAEGKPQPFALLQQRIGRKVLTDKILTSIPVVFQAYDLLEAEGNDCRSLPLAERRALLEQLVQRLPAVGMGRLLLSPVVRAHSWAQAEQYRAQARDLGVEGLMLKRLDSRYGVGRKKGDWWKWKLDPMTVDAVLTMAQMGHGRRGDRFTDYTFAVFNEAGDLVPIAKAYSGLTDAEIRQLDRWIRQHTTGKFGPVRQVPPEQVFELGFEGIALSNRHKSGVALRFPRILRWRQDKPVSEVDTVATLKGYLT